MGRVSKNNLIIKCQQEFIDHFGSRSFYTATAPGRINIIGEHTDYNLGLAMPIAIDRWICSVVSRRKDSKVNICSSNFNEKVCLDMDDFDMPDKGWVKYSAGCVKVFMSEFGIDTGFDILIGGNVPIGFGVSSSAALEVSLLGALFYSSELKIDNYKMINENLGYSKSEINQMFAIGERYEYQDHPIHKMSPVHEKQSMFNRMTDMINNIKTTMGQIDEWKISLPTIYLNKSGEEIPAMNVYIIDFINNKGVCKIHFMNNEF